MSYLLAIETSGKYGSISLHRPSTPDELVLDRDLPTIAGSAQTLTAVIADLFRESHVSRDEIRCLGLVTGPGSFTGLRVGVATAKSLAYAWNIPIVEVDTLDVIHSQWNVNKSKPGVVHAVLDAYRGQLFAKTFQEDNITSNTRTIDLVDFLASARCLDSDSKQHKIVGPGCDRLKKFLEREITDKDLQNWASGLAFFGDKNFEPTARTVGILACEAWQNNQTVSPFSLVPHYFRASAAEEKGNKV
jgi:tRNA threonylcarbamoyladenosine biosynthesis protein TsaB